MTESKGYIYFVECFPLLFKVGISGNPRVRYSTLSGTRPVEGVSMFMNLIGAIEGTLKEEKEWHKRLLPHLIGKEWYRDSKEFRANFEGLTLMHGEDFFGSGYYDRGRTSTIRPEPLFEKDAIEFMEAKKGR